MEKNQQKFYNGFWLGEDCTFRVVMAKVRDTPQRIQDTWDKKHPGKLKFVWYKPFVGKILQVVEIHHNEIIWYINNSDGKGTKKLMDKNGGSLGHKGIYVSEITEEVKHKDWNNHVNNRENELNIEIDEWWMKNEPFLYAKHKTEVEELMKIVNGGNAGEYIQKRDKKVKELTDDEKLKSILN